MIEYLIVCVFYGYNTLHWCGLVMPIHTGLGGSSDIQIIQDDVQVKSFIIPTAHVAMSIWFLD